MKITHEPKRELEPRPVAWMLDNDLILKTGKSLPTTEKMAADFVRVESHLAAVRPYGATPNKDYCTPIYAGDRVVIQF